MVRPDTPDDQGLYGATPRRFAYSGDGKAEYVQALRDVVVAIMIEKYSAVEQLEEILSVPGVDMIQWGPSDYTMSSGAYRPGHAIDISAVERKVIETALKMASPASNSRTWRKRRTTWRWACATSASATTWRFSRTIGRRTERACASSSLERPGPASFEGPLSAGPVTLYNSVPRCSAAVRLHGPPDARLPIDCSSYPLGRSLFGRRPCSRRTPPAAPFRQRKKLP